MRILPTNLVISKNLLCSTSPWLLFVDLTIPVAPLALHFVSNTEDVVFDGNTYLAFPFEFAPIKSQGKGEIPSMVFRVSNVTKAFQSYLEDYEGLIGEEVTLRIVNSGYLNENYTELTWVFTVLACVVDVNWISFTVGSPNPLRRRFPLYRYNADHCPWQFGSVECKYDGVDTICKRTLSDCQARTEESNSLNFGGHIGLGQGGIRLV
jgi:phage-related protein